MKNKYPRKLKNIFLTISVLLILVSCGSPSNLERKINDSLKEKYGMDFGCESISVDGGGVFFISYPTDDTSLHFDGFADSETGYVIYDTFPGAYISKEDTQTMTEILSTELGEVYAYAKPIQQGLSRAAELIRNGDYSMEELRYYSCGSSLFFYIFINDSSDSFIDDPGQDYDALKRSVEQISSIYEEKYDRDICVDMHIYYVDGEAIDYIAEYFKTHVSVDWTFQEHISSKYRIVLQMGSEDNVNFTQSTRLTREEYVEERERMYK